MKRKFVRINRWVAFFYTRGDLEIFIGPYACRLIANLSNKSGFAWLEGQNAIIRFSRRFWSGWHRWDDGTDYP